MNDYHPFGGQNPAYRATPYLILPVLSLVLATAEETTDMSLSFSNAVKAKQLREYFNRHGRIYIVVDATNDDVQLPDSLKGDPALRLVLNMRMPQQIHIKDDQVSSDFSFGGQIYPCQIPIHTIWAAYLPEGELEQGIIWDDSVPEMIKAIVQAVSTNMSEEGIEELHEKKTELEEQPDGSKSEAATISPITVIDGGATEKKEDEPKKRSTSHLRVVK